MPVCRRRALTAAHSPRRSVAPPTQQLANRALLLASTLHFTTDACSALLYPLLPLIAADLHLSFAQVGLVRAAFSGASSLFQIPAGLLGERFGEVSVLLVGNAWIGLGLAALALASGYGVLLAVALIGGIGGNAQHPLGATLVARTSPPHRTATALGTLHFAGDLGKLLAPLLVGVLAVRAGWRSPLIVLGLSTSLVALVLYMRRATLLPNPPPVAASDASVGDAPIRPGFTLLIIGGALDSATQGASLTFLPFLFAREGFGLTRGGTLLGIAFASGAVGKFLCGWLSDRWGTLVVIVGTEALTAATLLGFVWGPAWLALPLAPCYGFAVSGTASALATAVTAFAPGQKRGRAYGTIFTVSLTSGAVAPLLYGAFADRAGLTALFLVMAVLTIAIVPVVLPLRRALAA